MYIYKNTKEILEKLGGNFFGADLYDRVIPLFKCNIKHVHYSKDY